MDLPPHNTIFHGDSLAIMPTLPEESFDLIFADPPYNLQLRNDLWRPNLTHVDAVNDEWDQFEGFGAYDAFTQSWLIEARRLLAPRGSIWVSGTYHNIFRVGAIMQDLGYWVLNTVTWFKRNAMPNFRGTRLKNDVEYVIWASRAEGAGYTFHHHMMKRYNAGKQLGSVWDIPACGGAERLKGPDGAKLHSTQKPEALLERIIVAASTPGDRVLDPFSGTGTTAAVAKRLHRSYIGIERDAVYVEASRARLDAVEPLPGSDPLIREALKEPPRRVPFRELIELGLIQVGDTLLLDDPGIAGTVTEAAKVRVDNLEKSIHRMGAALKGTPSCNGWKHWHHVDAVGNRTLLDDLRKQARRMLD